jgi:hypothetical protein
LPTLNVVVVIDTSATTTTTTTTTTTATKVESLESLSTKPKKSNTPRTKKKLFLSKKLQSLKVNFEAKLHKNLKPFPLITNESSNSSSYIQSETLLNEIFLDIEQYDNKSSILNLNLNKKQTNSETSLTTSSGSGSDDSDDQFPLIDKDSIDEPYEPPPPTQMSTNQSNTNTKMQLPTTQQQQPMQVLVSTVNNASSQQLRPNPHINISSRFGFKPTGVSVPLSSIPSIKTNQNLISQTNNKSEHQNPTHKNAAVPLSNSNPQLKKFEALNIQLSESESSSLSSVSSSSSASSSSSSSSSSFAVTNSSQSNSKNKSNTSSLSTDIETDCEKKQDPPLTLTPPLPPSPSQAATQAATSTNSQLISFLKHPINTFNSLNSNKTAINNVKSQPSIPTILRQKSQNNQSQHHQTSMHSLSYASLSSNSSTTSVKIANSENEKIISSSVNNKPQLPLPQSRFIQPKRQNQLLNASRIKKNSPVRKPVLTTTTTATVAPNENLSSDITKVNKLTTELLPKNDANIKIIKQRRIFCPYSHNSTSISNNNNNNTSDNVSITSSSTSDSISSSSNRDDISESNVQNVPSPAKSSLVQPTSYKLLSQLGGYKSSSNIKNGNEAKTKYFSKLPHKMNSQPEQSKEFTQPNEAFKAKPLESNRLDSSETFKKEDSAYCSSTSSTVSSNEVVETTKTNVNDKANEFNYHSIENIQKTAAETVPPLLENEEIGESNKINTNNVDTTTTTTTDTNNKSPTTKNSSQIQDSLGELNHLMMNSTSSSIPVSSIHATSNSSIHKQRKLSTTSFSSLNPSMSSPAPMFKPPSQLPPVENGEIIQLDIETYRFLMQDLQSTKAILLKVANMLREPSSDLNVFETAAAASSAEQDLQNMKITNPFVASLYNFQIGDSDSIEKFDQSTQTDN